MTHTKNLNYSLASPSCDVTGFVYRLNFNGFVSWKAKKSEIAEALFTSKKHILKFLVKKLK